MENHDRFQYMSKSVKTPDIPFWQNLMEAANLGDTMEYDIRM